MHDIQDPFAHIPFFWEWLSVLFAELAGFTYTRNLLLGKCRKSDYDSFRLHPFKLLEINVDDLLVPRFQVGFDFHAVCEHGGLHLARLEDEHSAFSTTVRYDLIVFFNEALFIIELYLHTLFDNLAD